MVGSRLMPLTVGVCYALQSLQLCLLHQGRLQDRQGGAEGFLCLHVMTLRTQLVHGHHHGITVTAAVDCLSRCKQPCLHVFRKMIQQHLKAVLA